MTAAERRDAIERSPKPRMHVIDLVDNCGKHKASPALTLFASQFYTMPFNLKFQLGVLAVLGARVF